MVDNKPIKVDYSKVNYEVEGDSNILQEELNKLTEESFADASSTRTLKNIKETLSKHLKKKYGIKDKEKLIETTNEILKIHGMSDEHFDPMKLFSKFTSDKLNDVSIDANANKNEVSIRGSLKEAETPFDKLIGYDYLYRVMKELYGQDEAKRLSGEMYDYSLALSDSSNILLNYCYAIDSSKLITMGRDFGVLPSKPVKSIDSYVGCLLETIHQMSNHLAGACLHKDMPLIIEENGIKKSVKIKDLVDNEKLDHSYQNYQGDWWYTDISNKNINVLENEGKFVKINKVMKRKYDKDIYIITTASGKEIKCSEDHIFACVDADRKIEIKAKDLKLQDDIISTDFKNSDNHTDKIIGIEKIKNDDEYVYEIETETHWYSVNGLLTHNCAIGGFFTEIAHLLIYKHRYSLDDIKNDKTKRKFIENKFQHFIHSVNSLSRNGGVESPFTNVSIFDKTKLKKMVEDYDWLFPKKTLVLVDNNLGGEECKLSIDEYRDFVVDYIFELQKIFIDFFDKGDPSQNGLQYRFPVCFPGNEEITINNQLTTFEIEFKDCEYGWTDIENLNKTVSYYDDQVKIKKVYKGKSKEFITINNEQELLFNVTPDHKLVLLNGELIEAKNLKKGDILKSTEGEYIISNIVHHIYPEYYDVYNIEVDNEEHLFTLPNGVVTSNCTVNLTKSWDEDKKEYVLDDDNDLLDYISHKDIAKYNIFSSLGTKIASCCRMINDTEMMELGSTMNSFGGSGGSSIGSHRVVTINFARIAIEAESYDNYLEILKSRVLDAAKILKAHKVLIMKLADIGQQPFVKNYWINMNRMFSTYGVLGLYEARKILQERFNHKDFHYQKDILQHFSKFCKEISKEVGIMFNIEQIPAESMAPRLAKCDKIIFGDEEGYITFDNGEESISEVSL